MFLSIMLLISSFFVGCNTSIDVQQECYITPLMWRATSPYGQVVYIFGSIHVADNSIYPLPDFIMDAFHRSDYLAVEIDLLALPSGEEAARLTHLSRSMTVRQDEKTLVDDIGEELFERTLAVLQVGDEHELDYFLGLTPAGLFMRLHEASRSSVENAGFTGYLGVDMHFIRLARERGIEVIELESIEIQMKAFLDRSLSYYVDMIEHAIETMEDQILMFEEVFDAWKRGCAQFFVTFSREMPFDEISKATRDEFVYYILIQRDICMTYKIRNFMAEEKNMFVVVGAAHLVGEGSIIDLLIQGGYDVTRVT